MESFSTMQTSRILKCDRERIRSWMEKKYIEPTSSSGIQGKPVVFSRYDIYHAALFKLLVDRGYKRETVAGILKFLKQIPLNEFYAKVSYITISFAELGGEEELRIDFFEDEKFDLGFDPKKLVLKTVNHTLPGVWSDIHVVNVLKIKKDIDIAIDEENR